MVRIEPIKKRKYRRERENISSQFYRFGHADVTKIRKTRAIQALRVIPVFSLRAALKLWGASLTLNPGHTRLIRE